MSDPLRPNVVTRVRAALRGERDAAALEALRAAGVGVYMELAETERRRAQLLADGGDLWTAPASVGGHLLATWNAFVLQTLGAGLLDADYAADPGTVGFVPAVSFDQAWSWFSAATGWLSQARQAHDNLDLDLGKAFSLPAGLPAFAEVEPCPVAHLQAMLTAIPAIREHAELALFDLDRASLGDAHAHAVNTVRQLAAEAGAADDYARAVAASPAGVRLHELIEAHLKRAVTLWFHVGQLAAMPTLIGGYRPAAGLARVDPQTLPGGPRFDPWCLTDRGTLAQWKADPRARQAIASLWDADPDPARTLSIRAEIDAALTAGTVTEVQSKKEGNYYFCCPWSPIFQVQRPVRIAGRQLAAAQQFTFDVSAEELGEGGEFVRRLVIGPFHVTTDIDYCDPGAGGHDD